MYSLRTPALDESHLVVASGKEMEVELIGDLDIVLHCDEDVVVTLRDVAYIPGLWGELISFNVIQDHRTIILDKSGAHMLGGRVRFTKTKHGYFVRATRVPQGSRGPPAMVAPVLRPSPHSTPSPRRSRASGAGVGSGTEEQRDQMEPKQTQRSPRQQPQPQPVAPQRQLRTAEAGAGVRSSGAEEQRNFKEQEQTQRSPPHQWLSSQPPPPQRRFPSPGAGAAGGGGAVANRKHLDQVQRISSPQSSPQRHCPSPGTGAGDGSGAVSYTHLTLPTIYSV